MGRPRKATNVLEASGAFDKNPQRRRERGGEPIPTGEIGDPPPGFGKTTRKGKAWREIVENCPPKVLANSDRILVELAATLMAEFRKKPEAFTAAMYSQLRGALGSLGMDPASRSKINVGPPEPENKFDDLDD